jgi:hypothetical protein
MMDDLKKAIEGLSKEDAVALLDHWWATQPETLSHWWAIKIEEEHAQKA